MSRRKIILALFAFFNCNVSIIAQTNSAATRQSVDRGKLVYQQVCLTCHQADGGGVPNMNPPLIKSAWASGDKKRLINVILKGFAEKVAINGNYYNNNMPAQISLTDQQVADVLTYIRTNFGNKARPILPKDVAVQRKALPVTPAKKSAMQAQGTVPLSQNIAVHDVL
jgi:mono/diheme cytochrome c family protein